MLTVQKYFNNIQTPHADISCKNMLMNSSISALIGHNIWNIKTSTLRARTACFSWRHNTFLRLSGDLTWKLSRSWVMHGTISSFIKRN